FRSRDGLRRVGHGEAHIDAVALDAARLHDAADAEGAAERRLLRRDLGRAEEEHQVLLKRLQHERGRDAERDHAEGDRRHTLVPGFHGVILSAWRLEFRLRRTRKTTSSARATKVTV